MNSLIISNSTSSTTTAANEIRLDFPGAALRLDDQQVALNYLGMYYSWRNVTSSYQNNSFKYRYNGTTYPVNLPDGFYLYSDINNVLHETMRANQHYCLDVDGNPVYFIELAQNMTYYSVTWSLSVVAVPAGGTNPFGLVTGSTMQLIIDLPGFGVLTGTPVGTYPAAPSTALVAFNSPNVPQISPVTTVHVATNISTNTYNQFSDIIHTFTPTSQYGSFLVISPSWPVWYSVLDGSYRNVSIRFYDQEYRPLQLVDKGQMSCTLVFRSKLLVN